MRDGYWILLNATKKHKRGIEKKKKRFFSCRKTQFKKYADFYKLIYSAQSQSLYKQELF